MNTAKDYAKFLQIKKEIMPFEEINERVTWLKDYLKNGKFNGYVIGVSGGVDSALVGFLAQKAIVELQEETAIDYELHALHLPYKEQKDIDEAEFVSRAIKPFKTKTINIASTVDGLVEAIDEDVTDFNKGNLKSRARMVALYLYASQHNLLVLGSDNAAEMITGFFTKFGDGGYDINPIQSLSKRQVRLLLSKFNLPEHLVQKLPTADLLDDAPGIADEEVLGMTYHELDDYIENWNASETNEVIEAQFKKTIHKREFAPAR